MLVVCMCKWLNKEGTIQGKQNWCQVWAAHIVSSY